MIKFFRKIRQNLLMENKTSKYFKYAIGEIILVVIGILIALQVNNWNELRKQQTQKQSYLLSLYDNLQQDSIRIHSIIRFYKEDQRVIDDLIERVETSNHVLDTMQKLARYDFNMNMDIISSFNDETYQILINTGNIDLLDKELVQRLIQLNKIQSLALSINNMSLDFYTKLTIDYGLKYSAKTSSPFSDRILDPVWEDVNEKEFVIYFNALVSGKEALGQNVLYICKPLIEATELLLEVIRKLYPNLIIKS
jgi:hypothetical protein